MNFFRWRVLNKLLPIVIVRVLDLDHELCFRSRRRSQKHHSWPCPAEESCCKLICGHSSGGVCRGSGDVRRDFPWRSRIAWSWVVDWRGNHLPLQLWGRAPPLYLSKNSISSWFHCHFEVPLPDKPWSCCLHDVISHCYPSTISHMISAYIISALLMRYSGPRKHRRVFPGRRWCVPHKF